MLLGKRHDALDSFGTVFQSGFIVHAFAISGKGNHLGDVARFGGKRNAFFLGLVERVVIFLAVEGIPDAADSTGSFKAAHGAFQIVLGGDCPLLGEKNLNGFNAHLFDFATKLVERDFSEAPVANGVFEAGIGASGIFGCFDLLSEGLEYSRGAGSESGK